MSNYCTSNYWQHAPAHRLSEAGTFIVTSGTRGKLHRFAGEQRLTALHDGLLRYAKEYGWDLGAWAVFPNHYHFVSHSPDSANGGPRSLRSFLAAFHQNSSSWVNSLDDRRGRQVWHNFWGTRLSYENSFRARLNYVHQNAVHRGIVPVANQYRWCSAAWFEQSAIQAQVRTVYSFKIDQLRVLDDF